MLLSRLVKLSKLVFFKLLPLLHHGVAEHNTKSCPKHPEYLWLVSVGLIGKDRKVCPAYLRFWVCVNGRGKRNKNVTLRLIGLKKKTSPWVYRQNGFQIKRSQCSWSSKLIAPLTEKQFYGHFMTWIIINGFTSYQQFYVQSFFFSLPQLLGGGGEWMRNKAYRNIELWKITCGEQNWNGK